MPIEKPGLIKAFKLAAWGASIAKNTAVELVTSPFHTLAGAADFRRFLNVLDKAPGIEEKKADAEFLNNAVAIFQMDRLTFCISYSNDDRTDINIMRMDHINEQDAIKTVGGIDKFSGRVISQGSGKRKPDITMIVNTENLSENGDHISADSLAEAMTIWAKTVPFAGDAIAFVIKWPVRKIADFILSTIYEQARNVKDMITNPELPPLPPPPPKPSTPPDLPPPVSPSAP